MGLNPHALIPAPWFDLPGGAINNPSEALKFFSDGYIACPNFVNVPRRSRKTRRNLVKADDRSPACSRSLLPVVWQPGGEERVRKQVESGRGLPMAAARARVFYLAGSAPSFSNTSCAALKASRPAGMPQYAVACRSVALISSTVTPFRSAPLT
jgi:hypothetical protein